MEEDNKITEEQAEKIARDLDEFVKGTPIEDIQNMPSNNGVLENNNPTEEGETRVINTQINPLTGETIIADTTEVVADDRSFDEKVSDVDPSLDITHEEVLPLIYEAAQSCRPPLFKDQPQEKININSKLGFGMHDELKLDNEGETQWYTPMSCEKIKLHMPNLCHPNVDCKKIGNPLTFYNRKRKLLKRDNKGQVNNNGD